jgi:hypothetical protein
MNFVQHKNVVNILRLDPRLISINNININTEPHLYQSLTYGVYMVEVDDRWVPALNLSFGMYYGDTVATGVPNTRKPSPFLQRRVFITLPHGEYQRFRAFHFMLTTGDEIQAPVNKRWEDSFLTNEHIIDIASWGKYIKDVGRPCKFFGFMFLE